MLQWQNPARREAFSALCLGLELEQPLQHAKSDVKPPDFPPAPHVPQLKAAAVLALREKMGPLSGWAEACYRS